MTDFLLELRSEEIPARMQPKAKEDLARLFTDALAKAGLAAGSIETFATPRRLALIAHGLPLSTEAVSEETKGPKVGAPPQALEGFLRKTGLTQDQLVERDGVYFAVVERAGRAAADVLVEAIPAITRAFPWPKSQRWGAASVSTESLRWVRPLQGIVALLGDDVVPCEIEGITSGRETTGHRFMHSGPVSIANPAAYVESLRAAHVIVHYSERCRIIREGAAKAATDAGLVLVEDEGLVSENAGLTEWPVPLLGRFDPAFLAVPEEVIQLTARVNQKYFVCKKPLPFRGGVGVGPVTELPHPPTPSPEGEGELAPAFICTANIEAKDGGAAIIAGNEKVLAARLSDAKFFWETDLKVKLEEQAAKLGQITFHEKLGTVADKVERVAKLARWLVEEGIVKSSPLGGGAERSEAEGAVGSHSPSDPLRGPPPPAWEDLAALAERAARLAKADLVTGSVGEFPELQGIVGGHLARAQGEHPAVADAIRDHYKPVGQGDDVPTAPVTVAMSLADKLDTLVGFFIEQLKPTGSKDPFALRRAAIGCLDTIGRNAVRASLREVFFEAGSNLLEQYLEKQRAELIAELRKRYKNVGEFLAAHQIDDADIDHSTIFDLLEDAEKGEALADEVIEKIADTYLARYGFVENQAVHLAGSELLDFFADRLKVQQREAGVRHDLIDAVFALGGEDDLVRLLARVHALQAFIGTEDGANLLAGYKRAANLLKQAGNEAAHSRHPGPRAGVPLGDGAEGSGTPDQVRGDVDGALESALDHAEPAARAAVEAEDFTAAMTALASLRAPIDAFFEGVMVNDPDPEVRAFRLGLLARFRDAVHAVADFSKIEG